MPRDHRAPQEPHGGTPPQASGGGVRLQRLLADAGVASRRDCEALIEAGRVEVNGEVVSRLPVFVNPRKDKVSVDGRPVEIHPRQTGRSEGKGPEGHVYLMVFKPDNTLTTTRDANEGDPRRTVYDLLEKDQGGRRLILVGRLGYHATGLVLLTSDGELANRLSHARYGVTKTYRIAVRGRLHDQAIESLKRFTPEHPPAWWNEEEDGEFEALKVVRESPSQTTIELVMRAGAGAGAREPVGIAAERPARDPGDAEDGQPAATGMGDGGALARMLTRMGNPIRRLERIAIGPVSLRFLEAGDSRKLTKDEVRALREASGLDAPTPRKRSMARKPVAGRADFKKRSPGSSPQGRPSRRTQGVPEHDARGARARSPDDRRPGGRSVPARASFPRKSPGGRGRHA